MRARYVRELTSATTRIESNRSSNPIAAAPGAIFEVETLSRAQIVSSAYSWGEATIQAGVVAEFILAQQPSRLLGGSVG